jgi:transcriptional regulator with PAS, ATPase and Fis domain
MPRHAPALECSAEDKSSLVAIRHSRTEEARDVERARIILACLEGKQIQQVAQELGVSVPTISKWRKRFALVGPERSTGPAPARQAGHLRRRFSAPRASF